MIRELDDAAINAALLPPDGNYYTHYYRSLQHCKNEIKQRLRFSLNIPHQDIYLLANSTHCLLTVLHGLAIQGRALTIGAGSYRPYRSLSSSSGTQHFPLITHISPDSGNVASMRETSVVLDAAQSAGTVCYHAAAFSADVVFFPLHKHLALQIGVGVLCVSGRHEYDALRETALISESGTASDLVLKPLQQRLSTQSLMFNIAMFSLTSEFAEEFIVLGFVPVTPMYSRTPFLVFKTTYGYLPPGCLQGTAFSMKMLDATHLRISCYLPGDAHSAPVECSATLIDILRSKL